MSLLQSRLKGAFVRPVGVVIGVLVLGGIGAAVVALRWWPMLNIVETGRTPAYPDMQPRIYERRAGEVFDAALHAVDRLSRWSLVGYDEKQGDIRAEARTRVWRFVDDVTIHIDEREGKASVDVRSASRVGRGDFGQNARNIRRFLDELDRQLAEAEVH